jgi:hypothetical protein
MIPEVRPEFKEMFSFGDCDFGAPPARKSVNPHGAEDALVSAAEAKIAKMTRPNLSEHVEHILFGMDDERVDFGREVTIEQSTAQLDKAAGHADRAAEVADVPASGRRKLRCEKVALENENGVSETWLMFYDVDNTLVRSVDPDSLARCERVNAL